MIIVTGAAGFIGSNIVRSYNRDGRSDIVACDWLRQDERWLNLRKAQFRDFIFPEDLIGELDRLAPSAIFHIGANSSTTASDGDEVMRVNFQHTLRLLDWCTLHQVPFIYASSAATYGDGALGFVDDVSLDALKALRPLNLYGWSKHQIDLIVAERIALGLPLPPRCIGLKFFNVYGPNEYHKQSMMSVVAKNHAIAAVGDTVQLFKSHNPDYADGGQLRDFIHVDDVVRVCRWFADDPAAARHGVFNVGTGQARSFKDLIEALFTACGREPSIEYVPMPEAIRDKYQYYTQASLENLRAAGYAAPFLSLEDGVARYVEVLGSADRYV
ncbi:MAG: ADP-glyceromanno-heptose 6-epimerase [Proteobacteria bacterium]|nr:ADP-glyceromanno-heptose 6-epimerase [Pseudomonadota bacterium]